jgi:NADPH:quinone reductase
MPDTTRPSSAKRFVLAARPVGFPQESDFRLEEAPLPGLQPGQVLLKTLWLSVDPYMRGRISGIKSYAAPVEIGGTMVGGAVGEVVESNFDGLQPGDIVEAYSGWQEYAVYDGKAARKLDPSLAPVQTALGVLGMPGLTAYFGLIDICAPKAGETVVVSGAAGAVGSIVGQIARALGCRVVGVAGEDDKIDWLLRECGFDAAFNYKKVTDYRAEFKKLCPNGVDCYFDNVGGPITDGLWPLLNVHARVCVCGQISQYNNTQVEMGPRNLGQLIVSRAKVQGMLVSDYAPRFPEGLKALAGWLREGKIQWRETVVEGFENTPKAFIQLLQGANTGKMLVKA